MPSRRSLLLACLIAAFACALPAQAPCDAPERACRTAGRCRRACRLPRPQPSRTPGGRRSRWPGLDAEAATDAWLATRAAQPRRRSDAYFEGGYWLLLWDLL